MFVERDWLQRRLAQGESFEQIGRNLGLDGSTVAWWARRLGLRSQHADRAARRGQPDRDELRGMAADGATLAEMATRIDRSISTVKYWLARWEIERAPRVSRRADPTSDPAVRELRCKRHGLTEFRLEGRGYYRCKLCRQERVVARRRRVKLVLTEEAGGRCVLCGYARCPAALQFHHLDPSDKAFELSRHGITRSIARARAEAAKCVLLCANCHAEVEVGYTTVDEVGGSSPGWTRTTMA